MHIVFGNRSDSLTLGRPEYIDEPTTASDTSEETSECSSQEKENIPNPLDSITIKLKQITGEINYLEPKTLYLTLSICTLSALYFTYAAGIFQQKPDSHFTQMDDLFKQPEQVIGSVESNTTAFNPITEQPDPLSLKAMRPTFFSLIFATGAMGAITALWRKLNHQSARIEKLERTLAEYHNNHSAQIEKWEKAPVENSSDHSEQIEKLRNELAEERNQRSKQTQELRKALAGEHDQQSAEIQKLIKALDEEHDQRSTQIKKLKDALDQGFTDVRMVEHSGNAPRGGFLFLTSRLNTTIKGKIGDIEFEDSGRDKYGQGYNIVSMPIAKNAPYSIEGAERVCFIGQPEINL